MTLSMGSPEAAFEQDMLAYLSALPSLLATDKGKFALVGCGALSNVFVSRLEALAAGYARFGDRGFLVQEVSQYDLEKGAHWHRG